MTPLCENIRTSFSDYLDGAVSGHEMQAIAAHLESCKSCTEEFEALARHAADALHPPVRSSLPRDLGLKLRLGHLARACRPPVQLARLALPASGITSSGHSPCRPLAASPVPSPSGTTMCLPARNRAAADPRSWPTMSRSAPSRPRTIMYSAVMPQPIVVASQATDRELDHRRRSHDQQLRPRLRLHRRLRARDGSRRPRDPGSGRRSASSFASSSPARVFGVPVKGHVRDDLLRNLHPRLESRESPPLPELPKGFCSRKMLGSVESYRVHPELHFPPSPPISTVLLTALLFWLRSISR